MSLVRRVGLGWILWTLLWLLFCGIGAVGCVSLITWDFRRFVCVVVVIHACMCTVLRFHLV